MHEFKELPVDGVIGEVNNKIRIDGCLTKKQRLIPDDRGFLMELQRSDWDEFNKWGQVYVTMCLPHTVKGFHHHYKQVDYFNCVRGMSKVVLFDDRPDSPTRGIINEFIIGRLNPTMVVIPNYVWHGFSAVGEEEALIINCPTEAYNYKEPDEYRAPYNAFGYEWFNVNG